MFSPPGDNPSGSVPPVNGLQQTQQSQFQQPEGRMQNQQPLPNPIIRPALFHPSVSQSSTHVPLGQQQQVQSNISSIDPMMLHFFQQMQQQFNLQFQQHQAFLKQQEEMFRTALSAMYRQIRSCV
ncbi:uncharacterized protein LOC134215955 [Armigeres subalbatus]|uniref:uncharacterized protein LOC134215955 n=1 Tax=Armigeres subalbatus TaxID=124917 RepID=UPI002ED23477